MKYCSKKHGNPDDAEFCHECGEKLEENTENVCQKCKAVNPKDAKFCAECGTSLTQQPKPKPQPQSISKPQPQPEPKPKPQPSHSSNSSDDLGWGGSFAVLSFGVILILFSRVYIE